MPSNEQRMGLLDRIAAYLSPTIDASPGRENWEDKIDRLIFDPQSGMAPLEAMLAGSPKMAAEAIKGVSYLSKLMKGAKAAKPALPKVNTVVSQKAAELGAKVRRKPLPARAAVREGMQHAQGGSSVEQIARDASGIRFFRVKPSGEAIPILQNAEDAAMRAGNDVIVKVLPDGQQVVEAGKVVGKKMHDAIIKLVPGKVRDVATTTVDLTKQAGIAENEEFLRSLGVKF